MKSIKIMGEGLYVNGTQYIIPHLIKGKRKVGIFLGLMLVEGLEIKELSLMKVKKHIIKG